MSENKETDKVEEVEETEEVEEIKEVKEDVKKTKEEEETMEDMMDEVDETMTDVKTGDILKGEVVSVDDESIMVNIGYQSDGMVPKKEVSNFDGSALTDLVSVGDTIDVKVLELDDGEGNVLLSKKRAEAIVAWDELEKIEKNDEIVELKVSSTVKGGVIGNLKGIRAFVPASQLSDRYIDDISIFVGETIETEIIELDRKKNKLVLSSKRLAKVESDKDKLAVLEDLKVGQKVKGKVMKLVDFGAFIDIGHIEGLLHNNDLSWKRVKHPSEIIKEGEEIEVTILNIDKDKKQVGLGFKDAKQDPWAVHTEDFKKGQVIDGKVMNLVDFGAFVRVADGVEGLVHISEISEDRIGSPSDVLSEGEEVKVKIIDIDRESKRISLSIKEAKNAVNAELVKEYASTAKESMGTIGDALGDAFDNLFN